MIHPITRILARRILARRILARRINTKKKWTRAKLMTKGSGRDEGVGGMREWEG